MGFHALLQGIFPTQGSNLGILRLLPWQVDSLLLTPPGKGCTQSERCIYGKPRSMSKWVGVSNLRPHPLAKIPLGNEITSFPQSLEWPRGTRVAGGGTACPLAFRWVAVPLLRLGCHPHPFCATPVLTLQAQVRPWHPWSSAHWQFEASGA